MVSSIGTGMGDNRTGLSMGVEDRVATLLTQIKSLRKRIAQLQKELLETSDPAAKMVLIKEIDDLTKFIQMTEQQIVMLEAADKQKKAHQHEAQQQQAREQDKKNSGAG